MVAPSLLSTEWNCISIFTLISLTEAKIEHMGLFWSLWCSWHISPFITVSCTFTTCIIFSELSCAVSLNSSQLFAYLMLDSVAEMQTDWYFLNHMPRWWQNWWLVPHPVPLVFCQCSWHVCYLDAQAEKTYSICRTHPKMWKLRAQEVSEHQAPISSASD